MELQNLYWANGCLEKNVEKKVLQIVSWSEWKKKVFHIVLIFSQFKETNGISGEPIKLKYDSAAQLVFFSLY